MVKTAEKVKGDMIIDLLNQIRAEEIIPTEWELTTIANCYEEKRDALMKEKYRGYLKKLLRS